MKKNIQLYNRDDLYVGTYYMLGTLLFANIFSSNHNIHKSWSGLCFWASDPLIERFL